MFSPVVSEAVGLYVRGGSSSPLGNPPMTRMGNRAASPGEELVAVTSPLLPHRIARGYADPFGRVVKDVDGVPVRNLRHLVEVLRDGSGEFLTIRFHGEPSETMVFRRRAIHEATSPLMAEHGIPSRGSESLMEIWKRGPAGSK